MALEYHVVFSPYVGDLEEAVNKRLEEGWELWGDLIIDAQDDNISYYQVVVKYNYRVPVTAVEEKIGEFEIPVSP